MSTIRLSCKGTDVFVPEADGTFAPAPYSAKTGTGHLARFVRPGDDTGAAKALNAAKRDLAGREGAALAWLHQVRPLVHRAPV